jgi:Outer membrane protein beta-barrel domain
MFFNKLAVIRDHFSLTFAPQILKAYNLHTKNLNLKTKNKIMKKLLFGTFAIMFALCSLQSTAQMKKGAYVGISIGYNAAAGAANVENFQSVTQTGTTTREIENIKFSFGKGINAGVNVGYMFNEHIGLDLGIQYLVGSKTKATSKDFGGDINTRTISAKMLQVKPSLVLATTMKNITPYAKLGLVLGSGKVTGVVEDISGSYVVQETSELKKGLAIGFNAALGINFPMSKNLTFSAEINTVNMQYSPKKGSITKYTENGVDELPSLSVNDREIEFVKKAVFNYTSPASPNAPRQQAAVALPFGSIGVNVGVKYSF